MNLQKDGERLERFPFEKVPRHVAVILDGNGRWAKRKNLSNLAGHRAGVDAVRELIEMCSDYGIEVLTLFAFSSENWKRPEAEVDGLMRLFLEALRNETEKLGENGVSLKVIGDISRFSPELQQSIAEAESSTANGNTVLVIAANYGGRWDIVQSMRTIAAAVERGEQSAEQIDESLVESHLSLSGLPPLDLMIRTSGEMRISNFLLWQCAYSELYFTDTLWPDFGRREFEKALASYAGRQRRFGMTGEQVEGRETC